MSKFISTEFYDTSSGSFRPVALNLDRIEIAQPEPPNEDRCRVWMAADPGDSLGMVLGISFNTLCRRLDAECL